MGSRLPFALFIRGPKDRIFALSDELGFDNDMQALAVSVFEDGKDSMHVQALYGSEADAKAAQTGLDLDGLDNFITQLPDEDWTAKSQAGLPPVTAGPFFVYGAHDKDKIPKDTRYPIQIDAGIAFGTGHHGTTKGCLLAFNELVNSGIRPARVLDLGCGAGVLAIAAAMALDQNVLATDIDPDAVLVTQQNAALNKVKSLITAVEADGIKADEISDGVPWDLVFANILAGPLLKMAPDISGIMANCGHVILSGILDEQAEKLQAKFENSGLAPVSRISLAGWTTLLMQK